MTTVDDQPMREQLVRLLEGRDAHMPFEAAVADFPEEAINALPPNIDYTPWHLVEHVRLTQTDMLDYVTSPTQYRSRDWPAEFWPSRDARATPAEFAASVEGFLADRDRFRALLLDPARDLFAPLTGTPGHTIARGARIIGDHNAYHVGEFAILRQVMGTWPVARAGR
jgi:hypothetical protein